MEKKSCEILGELKFLESKGQLVGAFSDIPIDVYHHPECPGYSSTTIKRTISQSFNHRHILQSEQKRSLVFGSAYHCFVNEPHLFDSQYIVTATDSKHSQEWKLAKKDSRVPLTTSEFQAIVEMDRKLKAHPDAAPLINGSKNEISYFSVDEQTGLLKKCRVDGVNGKKVWDLKSCENASKQAFERDARRFLYRISAAFYLEVISEVTGIRHEDFYLIPSEKVAPYEVNVFRVSEESIERAQEEIRLAMSTIAKILKEGPSAWAGYQLGVEDILI